VGAVRLLLVREFSVCMCVYVCVRARSLARLPSNNPVGFHEACSEDMTDKDET
jgi:hypothetical protein